MIFNYDYILDHLGEVDIEDIGNVTIKANNSIEEWYLNIATDLGWVTIEEFGPLGIDLNNLLYSFSYNYFKKEFNVNKIYSIIDKFLNSEKREITLALVIEKDEFTNRLKCILR